MEGRRRQMEFISNPNVIVEAMIISVKQLTEDNEFEDIGRVKERDGEREIVSGEDDLLAIDDRVT